MNRFFASIGKYCVVLALAFLLVFPLKAQISLREALDFDGDNKVDFSVFRESENNWYILGSGGSVRIQNFGLATEDFVAPGDYDGDNKGDIAVWRQTDGVWYILNSSNNTVLGFQWGTSGDEPVQRDYDGDGKTDLAVVRRTNGQMFWFIRNSANNTFSGYQWGLSTDYPAPGDYDGDLKFDIVVQRPGAAPTSQASFFLLCSTEGFKFYEFGYSNDIIAPGDYDGDGKTDLAVVREGATGADPLIWYILPSATLNFYGVQWGITGTDVIVQGDYDGDNRTDVAVWRNTDGVFYRINSTNGQYQGIQWGTFNDQPLANYDQW